MTDFFLWFLIFPRRTLWYTSEALTVGREEGWGMFESLSPLWRYVFALLGIIVALVVFAPYEIGSVTLLGMLHITQLGLTYVLGGLANLWYMAGYETLEYDFGAYTTSFLLGMFVVQLFLMVRMLL
jgi:hypothetical protein